MWQRRSCLTLAVDSKRFAVDSFSLGNQVTLSSRHCHPLSGQMVLQEAKKKMSPTNARALNAMRQRLKKHNINYQEQIKAFRCPCCLSESMLVCL